MLSLDDIVSHIHMHRLALDGCIVAVWVTNNIRQHESVKKDWFPVWSVDYITTWFWLKVLFLGNWGPSWVFQC